MLTLTREHVEPDTCKRKGLFKINIWGKIKETGELSVLHTSRAAKSQVCSYGGEAAPGLAGICPWEFSRVLSTVCLGWILF